eukprot:4554763-Prymnesium_polylepis.1
MARVGALRALVTAWEERFGPGGTAQERAAAAAAAVGVGVIATGSAWQLSGGSLVAPLLANAIAQLDAYALGYNADTARVNVPLPAECEGY